METEPDYIESVAESLAEIKYSVEQIPKHLRKGHEILDRHPKKIKRYIPNGIEFKRGYPKTFNIVHFNSEIFTIFGHNSEIEIGYITFSRTSTINFPNDRNRMVLLKEVEKKQILVRTMLYYHTKNFIYDTIEEYNEKFYDDFHKHFGVRFI